MREIKFRFRLKLIIDSWGIYKKGDIDTFYISLLDDENGLIRFPIDKQWEVISCDEFTGLTDNNGKEIYEGDLVKSNGDERVYKIKYSDKYASFVLVYNEGIVVYNINASILEITGNIYQTPDLL